jgi:DNA mismatch repair protein MLH3
LTGLGTSKYHATESLLGRNGIFLASLAAMSLLTISSHHHEHRSHNAITFHQSKAVERQIPASEQHEIQGKHGTRVTVRNLFGNLPVRVKQRSIISEQRAEYDRLWDGLKKDVTSLLLAWQSSVSIRIRDGDNRAILNLSISGSEAATRRKESEDLKPRSAQLSSILNVLTQANYIAIDEWTSWVPASASTSAISIKGAISLDPAPSKHVQFISFGIRPLSAKGGHNELFDAVNRLFALSSFGTIEDVADVDEQEKIRRQSDKRFKQGGYTNRQLKVRKDVDRYPMFYLRIALKEARRRSVSEDHFIEDETNLQNVMEVLGAMVTQWLSVHHFRPRQPRKKRECPSTASSAAEDFAINTPYTNSRTIDMVLRGNATRSLPATPIQSSTLSQSLKRKRTNKVASPKSSETSRLGAFAEWSRIKSGKPEFFSSISNISKLKTESASGKHFDANYARNTKHEAFANFDIAPLSQGALNGQYHCDEISTPIDTPGADNKENDDTILWTDPTTKKTHLLNARTGCVVPDLRSRPGTDSAISSNSITGDHTSKSMRLPTRASTAVTGKTPWLDDVLKTWENPVFKLSEKHIREVVSHDHEYEHGHHHSRHGCSRIDIDKAFSQSSRGSSSRLSKEGLHNAQVVAQVDKKFILVKMQDSAHMQCAGARLLVLVDQHAADERVHVEALLSELCTPLPAETGYQSKLGHRTQVASVVLEKPTQFAISLQERTHFTTHAARFASWGILYDVLQTTASAATPSTVDKEEYVLSVTALPAGISGRCKGDPKVLISFLRSTVWKYAEDPHLPPLPTPSSSSASDPTDWVRRLATCPPGLVDLINSRACRSAIMFNDELSIDDCKALVRNLAGCVFPFMCAHGRPSMVPLVDLRGLVEEAGGLGGRDEAAEEKIGFVDAWRKWKK